MAVEDPARWDFFVSYTQADKAWAEWIAWELEEAGFRVLVQAWDFGPGTNWVSRMQDGVTRADRTIAVLSSAYLKSQYGSAEWQAAWAEDPAGKDSKLLVVRVEDCERPGFLAGVVGVNLFGKGEAETRARLRTMVSTALDGRAKPGTAPVFPGQPVPRRAVPREPRFPGALPDVWKVPARNPNFTGRADDLAALDSALAAGLAVTVQSVRGMGGVGKSQLATEFAHSRAARYEAVYWIAAEETATIADQFADLATRLGLDPGQDPEALRDTVHDRLREIGGWLLIFDNAEVVADIRPWLPGGPQPPGVPGHVIVTTRRGGFRALGPVMDLDVLDLSSCAELLRARVPEIAENVSRDIAEELGRLPLAVEQAAAYLEQTGMSAGEYLALLRERGEQLIGRGEVTGRPETIATLWDIALERIGGRSPAAVALLELCSWLAPEPVPLDLFTEHADLLPAALSEVATDRLAFSEAVGVLSDYSLAKRTESHLQLHRLVQGAVRARGSFAAGVLGRVLVLLRADAPEEIMGAPQDWPRWAVLLPHVLAATDHFDRFSGEMANDARNADSWLLNCAAIYLQIHARLAEARSLAERALAIDEETFGPDHPLVAAILNNLAGILRDLGQPGEARPLVERALAIGEDAFGPDHPDIATSLSHLALILWDLRRPGEARPLAERALAIGEETLGPEHPDVAGALNNLALILWELGQPEEARPLAERALAIGEETLGPEHPHVATALNNLAGILRDLRQPGEARPLVERALAISENAYGPDHPDVAGTLNNLAGILRILGEHKAAEEQAERARVIRRAQAKGRADDGA